MINAANTSETSVNFHQTIRCSNPEGSHLNIYITQLPGYLKVENFKYSTQICHNLNKQNADI
jgi:hypothetical protein